MSQELDSANRLGDFLTLARQITEDTLSQVDALRDAVARNRDVTKSAVQLLQGLVAKLKEVRSPEDLSSIIADVEADTNELASAVAANTMAEPTPSAPSVSTPDPQPTPPADPAPAEPVTPVDLSPQPPADVPPQE